MRKRKEETNLGYAELDGPQPGELESQGQI